MAKDKKDGMEGKKHVHVHHGGKKTHIVHHGVEHVHVHMAGLGSDEVKGTGEKGSGPSFNHQAS